MTTLAAALAAALFGAAPLLQRPVAAPADVGDLPLVEVPATGPARGAIAILVTGDGGWAELDRSVAAELAARGMGVVGLNARTYLSVRRTPDDAAADVARVARAYLARWGAQRLLLVGYSRGADMLPFVASRLPPDLRTRTRLVAMLGLATTASFQFHWTDVVKDTRRPNDLPVAPELAKLRGMRLLCVYGDDEKDSGCRGADPSLVTRVARRGGHHFDRDYPALAALVADAAAP